MTSPRPTSANYIEDIKPVALTLDQDANIKTYLAASRRAADTIGKSLSNLGFR